MRAGIVGVLGFALSIATGVACSPARAGEGAVCGNGVLEGDERCDDGNTEDGDGCSSQCRIRLCLSSPPAGCIVARRAKLAAQQKVTETKQVGSMKLALGDFAEDVARSDFGDPVFDTTRYDLCVYNQNDRLIAQFLVDRGFRTCGKKQKACWGPLRDKGYRYRDSERVASGIDSLVLLGGPAGGGNVSASGRRTQKAKSLPLVTRNLENNSRASLRLMIDNGRCIAATLDDVKVAKEHRFRARSAPAAP